MKFLSGLSSKGDKIVFFLFFVCLKEEYLFAEESQHLYRFFRISNRRPRQIPEAAAAAVEGLGATAIRLQRFKADSNRVLRPAYFA